MQGATAQFAWGRLRWQRINKDWEVVGGDAASTAVIFRRGRILIPPFPPPHMQALLGCRDAPDHGPWGKGQKV